MEAMAESTVLLRCLNCGTVNRIPLGRLRAEPKCGRCKSLIRYPDKPVEMTGARFDREVLDNPGAVLLFFWASWCAHCRAMIPLMEEVAHEKAGIMEVAMINSEKEPSLARRFDVLSVPKLILYRYGRKIDEINGELNRDGLKAWIGYALSR